MKLIKIVGCFTFFLFLTNGAKAFDNADTFLDINGEKIHYQIKGNHGPWVILVHGVASDEWTFNPIFDQLTKYAKVLRYTRAGLGESSYKKNKKSFDLIVEELATLIKKLDIKETVILAGHSYGGLIIRSYTKRFPSDIKGLIFLDTTFEDYFPVLEPFIPQIRTVERNDFEHNYTSKTSQSKKDEIESLFKVWNSPEQWKKWFDILPPIPTTVITSLKTNKGPTRATNEVMLARYAAQSKLLTNANVSVHIGLKTAGHNVQRDNPEAVVEAFRNLINLVEKSN